MKTLRSNVTMEKYNAQLKESDTMHGKFDLFAVQRA
jgi:hypothetical protein